MSEIKFTRSHEWVCFYGRKAAVGITCRGINGDIVYAQLPEVGQKLKKQKPCAVVESAKTAVEVLSPVNGTVASINESVYDEPERISAQPYKTWLFILEDYNGFEDLLTKSEYTEL